MSSTKRRPTFLRFLICLIIGLGLAFGLLLYANPYYEGLVGRSLLHSGYFTIAAVAGLVIALFLFFPARKPLRLFKWIGRLLAMLVVAALIFSVGTIMQIQNDMLYPPVRPDPQEEARLRADPMTEEISVKSGNTLYHGYLFKRAQTKAPLLIYFGGNAEIAADQAGGLLAYLMDQPDAPNWHVMAVDYPGYAKSGGAPGEESIRDMAKAVMEYALSREDVERDKIVLMGWSLGTGPAVYLTGEYDAAGLILLAPFYNGTALVNAFIHDQMKIPDRFYTNLPAFLVSNKFPSDEYARKTEEQTLIIAAKEDHMINPAQAERLSREFKNVQYLSVEGGHSSVKSGTQARAAIAAFLAGIAGQSAPAPR